MQPWRRAVVEAGLTLIQVAAATGKSVDTVQAYSIGRRNPSTEWQEAVIRFASEAMKAA